MDWVHLDRRDQMSEWDQNIHPFGGQSLFKPLNHPTSLIRWHCSPCIKAGMDKLVLVSALKMKITIGVMSKGFFSWAGNGICCVFSLHRESPRLTLENLLSQRRARETQQHAFVWFTSKLGKNLTPFTSVLRVIYHTFATYRCSHILHKFIH